MAVPASNSVVVALVSPRRACRHGSAWRPMRWLPHRRCGDPDHPMVAAPSSDDGCGVAQVRQPGIAVANGQMQPGGTTPHGDHHRSACSTTLHASSEMTDRPRCNRPACPTRHRPARRGRALRVTDPRPAVEPYRQGWHVGRGQKVGGLRDWLEPIGAAEPSVKDDRTDHHGQYAGVSVAPVQLPACNRSSCRRPRRFAVCRAAMAAQAAILRIYCRRSSARAGLTGR